MSIEGAMMMGPDGAVYFIPSRHLEAFRVPDEEAEEARKSLRSLGKVPDVPHDIKVFRAVQGVLGYLPQAGPTTVAGFVDFGDREQ
jgi:hypothetical protein